MERRHTERTCIGLPIALETNRHSQSGTTVDISTGGACIRCDTSLVQVGEPLTIVLRSLRQRGIVAWSSMDRIGVRFEPPMSAGSISSLTG